MSDMALSLAVSFVSVRSFILMVLSNRAPLMLRMHKGDRSEAQPSLIWIVLTSSDVQARFSRKLSHSILTKRRTDNFVNKNFCTCTIFISEFFGVVSGLWSSGFVSTLRLAFPRLSIVSQAGPLW